MPKDQASNNTAVTKSNTQHCPLCADPDPHARSAHHMKLAADVGNNENGLDVLRAHLTYEWVTLRELEKRRPDSVDDVVAWVANLMSVYSGMADPETGAPLPWWKARKQMMQQQETIAGQAYQHAPARYRQQCVVEGFTHISAIDSPALSNEQRSLSCYAHFTMIPRLRPFIWPA